MTEAHYIIMAAGLNFLGILIITYINISSNKKNNSKKALADLIASKVDKAQCTPAMQRVGGQVDKLEGRVSKSEDCVHGLEKGMAFIVGKSGGNYNQIKNTGMNLGG